MAEINGPWEVEFPSKQVTFDKLISWPEDSDPAIKYFSGTATYRTEFQVAKVNPDLYLDLGIVHSIAKVRVNGQDLGILWKLPYRVDVSSALKPGKNTLEVEVVNTWHNRLIGDWQPGVSKPETFTSFKGGNAKTPLTPSGLLGPVTIQINK